jgi:hypothetical protein
MSARRDGDTAGFYRMGRGGIIALVVVIVLALAGGGLLAGALAGRDANPVSPTGGGDFKVTSTKDIGGQAAATHQGLPHKQPSTQYHGVVAMAAGTGLFQVSPTPTVGPVGSESPSPTESPTPTEIPTPGPTPSAVVSGVSLDGGTVDIPLPDGWSQIAGGDNWTLNFDGVEGYLYAEVDSDIDPSTDAAAILPQVFQDFIVADTHYSQLETGEVESYQPFGGIVSRAGMWYDGQYGDTQGTYGFAGKMFLGIRSDGKAFLMTVEIYPADDWDVGFGFTCGPVYVPAWQSFAAEAWPYDPCAS